MSENIKEIIEKIQFYNGNFPKQELQILLNNQEESTPYLLDSIRNPEECIDRLWEHEHYILPYYALFMLAQFREKEAYSLIYELFSYDAEQVDNVFGDLITEDLGRILASVCDGDVTLIKQLLENDEAYEFVRTATLNSWMCLLKAKEVSRGDLIEYFRYLFQKTWEEESYICGSIAWACLDIKATELLPEIEQKFKDNQIELTLMGDWNDYQKLMVEEKTDYLNDNSRFNNYVTDMISDLEKWAYFQEDKGESSEPARSLEDIISGLTKSEKQKLFGESESESNISHNQNIVWDSRYDGTFVHEKPKVGKNEPCPCGSGRKYKKCCINLR